MKKYKYGVSYNCIIYDKNQGGPVITEGFEEVGLSMDGRVSLDFVGNELEKLENRCIAEGPEFKIDRNHKCIGYVVDMGEQIVSTIFQTIEGDDYLVAVIFEDPTVPEIVK